MEVLEPRRLVVISETLQEHIAGGYFISAVDPKRKHHMWQEVACGPPKRFHSQLTNCKQYRLANPKQNTKMTRHAKKSLHLPTPPKQHKASHQKSHLLNRSLSKCTLSAVGRCGPVLPDLEHLLSSFEPTLRRWQRLSQEACWQSWGVVVCGVNGGFLEVLGSWGGWGGCLAGFGYVYGSQVFFTWQVCWMALGMGPASAACPETSATIRISEDAC